ncbi:MAG: hypothetical protein GX597_20045 [Anaerolineaceae bacterium]|nr:hypothetical protein [Anaerolineaceae bacterium]
MRVVKVVAVLAVIVLIVLLGWLGLLVRPRPFPPYAERTPELSMIPVPGGLPAPVDRFYRTVYGDEVPLIDTVVFTGRATMAPFKITLPARFVFVHNAGHDYRHYFEATWFGLPLMKVNEGYVDGASFFEAPVGTYYDDPNSNQGANLALWAEGAFFPSLFLTDPRARWEPVDEDTALLYVPFEDEEETFVVRFDPATGLMTMMESMRYPNPGDQKKVLWITRSEEGPTLPGSTQLSATGSATWLDQGKPWATFMVEDAVYNVDVSEYIRQRGQ